MKTTRSNRRMRLETMEKRELFAADLGVDLAMATAATSAPAEINFVETGGAGDSAAANDKWFVADSFSFGVEREMKESGEKGGTTDINIGVGELQECTISNSMGVGTAEPSQASDLAVAEVADEMSADSERVPYYKIKLEKVHVTHLSVNKSS